MTNHSDLKAALEAMRADRIPLPATKVEFLPFITVDLGDCVVTFPPDQIDSIRVSSDKAWLKLKNGECYVYAGETDGHMAITQLQRAITDMYKGPTL